MLPSRASQIHQCVVFEKKLYMTGKSLNGKNLMVFILDMDSMRVEEEFIYEKEEDSEDWADQDSVLWIQEN